MTSVHRLDVNKLTGPQKAAVFLLCMGEDFSSKIFRNMDEDEVGKLASKMAEIQHVPPDVVSKVMREFAEAMADDQVIVRGDTFLKTLTDLGLDEERAEAIRREIDKGKKDYPFNYLETMETSDIINLIHGEHPQTIAMILVHLKPSKGAEVLSGLPSDMQAGLAMRIAEIDRVPQEVVLEVDDALRKALTGRGGSGGGKKIGGIAALADILNETDKETEENVLSSLEEEREEVAEEVRQLMFIFEDLLTVDDRGMREILKQVESQQLGIALKTASDEMKEKIFSNLSTRAGEMLKEDMEVTGPVKISEVEAAQQAIIRVARELEADGKIVLAKGTDDVLV